MNKDWSRSLTFNERLYGIGEELNPPFAMQFVIQGDSLIDPELFSKAIDGLVLDYPVLLLKRSKKKWNLKGEKPSVIVHNKRCPSDFEDAIYRNKLDAEAGQCCEFHLFQTESTQVLIRVLHSAMDGIGAMKMIYALFALIRGEEVEQLTEHPSENELRDITAKSVPNNGVSFKAKWAGLKTQHQVQNIDFSTGLLSLTNKLNNGIGKVASWYMKQTESSAQFLIPVNCRRHGAFVNAAANLSLPIYLNTQLDQSADEIQANLLSKMFANEELGKDPLEKWANLVPDSVLKNLIVKKSTGSFKSNKYAMSGYIFDLGFIDLEAISFKGFKTLDFYSIPVYTAALPICFLILHHQHGTRICFSASSKYDLDAIKSSLTDTLGAGVEKEAEVIADFTSETTLSSLEVEVLLVWNKFMTKAVETKDLDRGFSDLGGESLSLLFIVEEIGLKHCPNQQGKFLAEVLKQTGKITIKEMTKILKSLS